LNLEFTVLILWIFVFYTGFLNNNFDYHDGSCLIVYDGPEIQEKFPPSPNNKSLDLLVEKSISIDYSCFNQPTSMGKSGSNLAFTDDALRNATKIDNCPTVIQAEHEPDYLRQQSTSHFDFSNFQVNKSFETPKITKKCHDELQQQPLIERLKAKTVKSTTTAFKKYKSEIFTQKPTIVLKNTTTPKRSLDDSDVNVANFVQNDNNRHPRHTFKILKTENVTPLPEYERLTSPELTVFELIFLNLINKNQKVRKIKK